MGTGASVANKPKCSYHRMREREIRKAKRTRYIDGRASDFYFDCANGNIDRVRQILDAPNCPSINELVKVERNGDTALHAATRNGHKETVELLIERQCCRKLYDRSGKLAYEVAPTPAMQRTFGRSEGTDRFHDSNTSQTMTHYLPNSNETDENVSAETNVTDKKTLEFVQRFDTQEQIFEYSLNHQTMAMWLKIFNWFSHTFPSFFQRDNLNLDSFHLHKNSDFTYFLREKLGDKYEETLKEFDKAHQSNSIKPLLTIYSSEKYGFYRSLNKQLADSPAEADTSPHLCDRFIIEFFIRGDELAKRSYLGLAYRGATIDSNEVSLYEQICQHKPRGVIAFKAFTSTSEDKDVALDFISDNPPKDHQTAVLFIINIKHESPTIFGIADASDFENEEEILFMPGNLFIVKEVVRDVVTYTKQQQKLIITEIHLEYLHMPVSSWKKLLHTYRSANNSVTN